MTYTWIRYTEFKADILGSLTEAYQPGRSYVEAFGRWMTRLFKSRGLILIDASHPRLKEMGREIFCPAEPFSVMLGLL